MDRRHIGSMLLMLCQIEIYNRLIKSDDFKPEDRLKLIEKLSDGICIHCGVVTDRCYCTETINN